MVLRAEEGKLDGDMEERRDHGGALYRDNTDLRSAAALRCEQRQAWAK